MQTVFNGFHRAVDPAVLRGEGAGLMAVLQSRINPGSDEFMAAAARANVAEKLD
jgi:hypothetical protein